MMVLLRSSFVFGGFILNNSNRWRRNSQESIVKVAKSTPVLEMLILRNKVSSTPDCRVRSLEKKTSPKDDKRY